MTVRYIHTIADSSCDNFFWMLPHYDLDIARAKQNTVEGLLQEKVRPDGYEVVSGAYDGFTTRSVLEGDRVGSVLPDNGQVKNLYMREKAAQGDVIYPLVELQKKISAAPDAQHYVVISIGGNDFRVNLFKPWRLLLDIPHIQKRYLQIVEKIRTMQGRNIEPILMLQYRTDANQDPYCIYPLFKAIGLIAIAVHVVCIGLLTAPLWIVAGKISLFAGSLACLVGALGLRANRKVFPLSILKEACLGKNIGMMTLGALMQSFYRPILDYAKKNRIDVLDLANTFHPYRKLYECGIEPNRAGGELIAEGVQSILKKDLFIKTGRIFSKPNQASTYVAKAIDPSKWQVAYPASLV